MIFDGAIKATRLASDVFDDDFHTCIDKSIEELEKILKTIQY
jgi:hypothetical protein